MSTEISVKKELTELIERVLKKHSWLGYNSAEEFITDTIRRRVELLLSLASPSS